MEFMPFNLEHRPGKLHSNADGLSRYPWDKCQTPIMVKESPVYTVSDYQTDSDFMNNWTLGQLSGWSHEEVSKSQNSDKVISQVLGWVRSGERPPAEGMHGSGRELWSYWHQFKRFVIKNDLLYGIWWKEGEHEVSHYQLVLPFLMKNLALYSLHDCAGHLGWDKTIYKLRERFYWFNLRDDTEVYIRKCLTCQQTKRPAPKPRAPLQNIKSGYPFERFGIDCVGPLPTTSNGNRFNIVVVDYFSKYPFAFASKDIKSETIAEKLMDNIVCMFGVPVNLHADQGTNIESNVFQKFCELIEIAKTRTTPFAPWSNGETERMNRTLINILKKMVSDHPKDWDLLLQKALMHYRSTVHSSTGFTPYRLMFGREMNLPVDIALNLPSEGSKATVPEYVSKQAEIINKTETLAREHMETAQNRQKKHYDIKKAGVPYKKGDLVLLLVKDVPTGQPRKFHKEYMGPSKIVTVLSDLDYRIQFIGTKNNGPVKRRKVRKIVHFNQLKLFYGDMRQSRGKDMYKGRRIRQRVLSEN